MAAPKLSYCQSIHPGTPEGAAVGAAAAWLRSNVPPVPTATALCHGDAGVGNFLFAGDKVTALLDWEFAHVGAPQDDLAWVAIRNHLLGRKLVE